MFGWFKTERRERRRRVRLDRKYLEARSRRFLKTYLTVDETRKPQFYRAVEEASQRCQPAESGLPPSELEDAQIAEATSQAAMKIVFERTALKKDGRLRDFLTDAYATVGIAYHRAAGVYTMDKEMQESWQILLQKSFWGDEQNFSEPLMRPAPRDVRDRIVSPKNTTDLRIGTKEPCSDRAA